MPTPSEPEAARASRAAQKHARKGPGKAGPLPPCYVSVTSRHRIACQRRQPLTQGFCWHGSGPQVLLSFIFAFRVLFSFYFCLFGLDLAFWSFGPAGPQVLPLDGCFLSFWLSAFFHFGFSGLVFLLFWTFWP